MNKLKEERPLEKVEIFDQELMDSIDVYNKDKLFRWIKENYISREDVEGLKMEIEKILEYKPRKNDSNELRIALGFKSKSDIININNLLEGVLKK